MTNVLKTNDWWLVLMTIKTNDWWLVLMTIKTNDWWRLMSLITYYKIISDKILQMKRFDAFSIISL